MKTPQSSQHFTRWTDPVSGVVSYMLTSRIAPAQQSFYFVNTSYTDDGRYLWLYCAFPPSELRMLAVLDFETDTLRAVPETQFLDASPLIDRRTGQAYWISVSELWTIGPEPGAEPRLVNRLPEALVKNRRPHRVATHLTFSADHSCVNIDAQIGNEWCVGEMPLDGGPVNVWARFDRCVNHAQFSPTAPRTMLLAEDGWSDASTGEFHGYRKRMWLLERGGQPAPLFPEDTPRHGHEWWDSDGRHIWYVHYGRGTEKADIVTRERVLVWPSDTVSHSHADACGKYLVSDLSAYSGSKGAKVVFIDVAARKESCIVSSMPCLEQYARYHVHPHPQFCLHDRYICYTSTALGCVDIALAPVDELIARGE